MYRSINPASEEVLGEFPQHTPEQIESVLRTAEKSRHDWAKKSFSERADSLLRVASQLEQDQENCARMISREMGKPLSDAIAEIKKCAWGCRYFAENAEGYLRSEPILLENAKATLLWQPMGVLFAIMPWNYPFWQLFRFAAPALMVGNTILLKHAPNVPQCALLISEIFEKAGFPRGVFQSVFVDNDDAASIIADKRVRGVTLTGSSRAGRAVAQVAGASLKPVVLELGGSDPFIVLRDADLESVVDAAILAKNTNNGQVCISAKRFLIDQRIYPDFVERFSEKMVARRLGDPMLSSTENGPMARADLKKTLQEQVEQSVRHGARVVAQGQVPGKQGYFFPPTVIENIHPGAPAYDEELFGPVACVFPFENEEEAIRLANDTPYGLGASIWTRDLVLANRIAPQIEAGQVSLNAIVRTDPRVPFGGTKESGFGKELGREGIREFAQLQTIIQSSPSEKE